MGCSCPRLDFDEAVLKHLNDCGSSLPDVYSDPNQATTLTQTEARFPLHNARYFGFGG